MHEGDGSGAGRHRRAPPGGRLGGPALSGLLLDTHVWFWQLIGSTRLSRRLKREIATRGDDCWISPISIWELGKLRERGRVELPKDYRAWLAGAQERFPCREAPLNSEIARLSLELDLATDDPADRFLAATATVFDLALATVDRRLIEADWLPTVSG